MEIDTVLELPNGSVKFQGTLEPKELEYVIQMGLNVMLQHGALHISEAEPSNIQ